MQVARIDPPSFMGVIAPIPVRYRLDLNQRELATLQRAYEIREAVRDRIAKELGTAAFESSVWYTLDIDTLIDDVPTWSEYDID